MSDAIVGAPSEVTLVYRQVGRSHVFTSKSAEGLHIGSSDLKCAFNNAVIGLAEHFTRLYGRPVIYTTDVDSDEFARRIADGGEGLGDSFVCARRTEATCVPA